jgi:uncharacterized membrane protein
MRRLLRALCVTSLGAWLGMAAMAMTAGSALAGPRSGSSFGSRSGFRSSAPSSSSYSRSYSNSRSSYFGGGPNVVVVPTPGYGYGYSRWGGGGCMPFGFGGFSLFGPVMAIGIAFLVMRALRRSRVRDMQGGWDGDDDRPSEAPGRAYVYKVQLGLGRSARGIQQRFEHFAAEGDTSSEAGLANLLQQAALELMREKESIRYAAVEGGGALSMTNAETKLNALALAERSKFQVERVRGAEGKVHRSQAAAATSDEVLEYLLVTIIVATRKPLPALDQLTDREQLEAVLTELGGVPPEGMLGLEVIWTPADPDDALTESDMLLTYPHLRGL